MRTRNFKVSDGYVQTTAHTNTKEPIDPNPNYTNLLVSYIPYYKDRILDDLGEYHDNKILSIVTPSYRSQSSEVTVKQFKRLLTGVKIPLIEDVLKTIPYLDSWFYGVINQRQYYFIERTKVSDFKQEYMTMDVVWLCFKVKLTGGGTATRFATFVKGSDWLNSAEPYDGCPHVEPNEYYYTGSNHCENIRGKSSLMPNPYSLPIPIFIAMMSHIPQRMSFEGIKVNLPGITISAYDYSENKRKILASNTGVKLYNEQ